jgi:hypothetical protein
MHKYGVFKTEIMARRRACECYAFIYTRLVHFLHTIPSKIGRVFLHTHHEKNHEQQINKQYDTISIVIVIEVRYFVCSRHMLILEYYKSILQKMIFLREAGDVLKKNKNIK